MAGGLVAILAVGVVALVVARQPQPARPTAGVPTPAATALAGPLDRGEPGAAGAAPEPAVAASQPTPAVVPTPTPSSGISMRVRVLEPTYTVEAGDNLSTIAARFNTTVELIQAINNLADPRALRVGQKLVIP